MTDILFKRLINKYAILLVIGMAYPFVINMTMSYLNTFTEVSDSIVFSTLSYSIYVFQLILNIITSIIVYNDMKNFRTRSNFIVVVSLLFSIVGVVMFLLMASRELKTSQMPPEIK